MFLKIMGDENAPDSDSRKSHRFLADVTAVNFVRVEAGEGPVEGCFAFVTFSDGEREEFEVDGNAYVLNDAGHTIDRFGSAALCPAPASA